MKQMTGSITFDDITFTEIEWRSRAVMADASHTLVRVAKQSRIAQRTRRELLYGQILLGIRSLAGLYQDLLTLYHEPNAILALEAATPEQLTHIVEIMREVHDSVERTISGIHPTRYWKTLYRPYLAKLKTYNDELASHTRAFSASDSALILLTQKDQDYLVQALLNPPAPSAKQRQASARK